MKKHEFSKSEAETLARMNKDFIDTDFNVPCNVCGRLISDNSPYDNLEGNPSSIDQMKQEARVRMHLLCHSHIVEERKKINPDPKRELVEKLNNPQLSEDERADLFNKGIF